MRTDHNQGPLMLALLLVLAALLAWLLFLANPPPVLIADRGAMGATGITSTTADARDPSTGPSPSTRWRGIP